MQGYTMHNAEAYPIPKVSKAHLDEHLPYFHSCVLYGNLIPYLQFDQNAAGKSPSGYICHWGFNFLCLN